MSDWRPPFQADRPVRSSNEPEEAGPVITAAFEGRCSPCGGRIDEGDEIRMQGGRAVHDGCEE